MVKMSDADEQDTSELDELIGLALDLPFETYGGDWHPGELKAMRQMLTGDFSKFPKRAAPYIGVMRKYLFQTSQLVAMAAAAHHHVEEKHKEEDTLIKPATFEDLGKLEAEKMRNE